MTKVFNRETEFESDGPKILPETRSSSSLSPLDAMYVLTSRLADSIAEILPFKLGEIVTGWSRITARIDAQEDAGLGIGS